MVLAFISFAKQYEIDKVSRKKGELGLKNEQYSNFQNLRHFGIIQQIDSQKWIVTTLGRLFLSGEASIPVPVAHLGGKTLSADHEAWETHGSKPEERYIWEILGSSEWEYKQHTDYAKEKSQQLKLV